MKKKSKLEIIYIPVADLVKLPGNPRKDVDAKAIDKLATLIREHGFQNPLQTFKENGKHTILAGNHRFDAGLTLGMTEFPCLVYTGSRKEAIARSLSDNKSNQWTDWDFPMLKDFVVELDAAGDFDLSLTGFTEAELTEMFGVVGEEPADAEPQTDKAEELNKVWKVKTGDLFQIGDHRLLCGDSTKSEDVARVMGGEKADMVSDPPYGIGYAYNQHDDNSNENNSMLVDAVLQLADGSKIYTPGLMNLSRELQKHPEAKVLVWHKGFAQAGNGLGGASTWEPVLCLSVAKGTLPNDYLHFGTDREPELREKHPCPKPISLFAHLIEHLTVGSIYDPFIGSGTTMVACQNLNRKCRGIEISPDYCAVILERMKTAFPSIEIKRIEKAVK